MPLRVVMVVTVVVILRFLVVAAAEVGLGVSAQTAAQQTVVMVVMVLPLLFPVHQ